MVVTIEQYVEILKFHEKVKLSTNHRNKFWKEYSYELAKEQIKRENES